tara:strand:+ start:3563 stop:4021 length:459 start_codon:yes stop_codon:yes gene_type:complete
MKNTATNNTVKNTEMKPLSLTVKQKKDYYKNIIFDNMTFEGYDLEKEPQTDKEKVKQLYKIFCSEYRGKHNDHINEILVFSEWLQGLPSTLTVPFYNYDILESAKKYGFFYMSVDNVRVQSDGEILERQEERFLNNYWIEISHRFFNLKNNL